MFLMRTSFMDWWNIPQNPLPSCTHVFRCLTPFWMAWKLCWTSTLEGPAFQKSFKCVFFILNAKKERVIVISLYKEGLLRGRICHLPSSYTYRSYCHTLLNLLLFISIKIYFQTWAWGYEPDFFFIWADPNYSWHWLLNVWVISS